VQLNWPKPRNFPELAAGEVHVWAVPLDGFPDSLDELAEELSIDERERAACFTHDKPRRVFVASRVALRSILGRYLSLAEKEVSIVMVANGKPQLKDGELQFNLAHSRNLALIAVTRGCEIGMDVELLRPVNYSLEIAARYFHPAERDIIHAAREQLRTATFLRCWTRKEAVIKMLGIGIGYPLQGFDVLSDQISQKPVELPGTECPLSKQCWLQELSVCDEYVAAVATSRPTATLTGFAYSC